MPSLIKTGLIPQQDLLRIKSEIAQISRYANHGQIGNGKKKSSYNADLRDSLVYFPVCSEIMFTWNYLTSLVIEQYSSLGIRLDSISVQYAKYKTGGHFIEHSDVLYSRDNSVRGFTLSVNLTPSEEYTGGDLLLTKENKYLDRKQGSFIIFPAYKRHRVDKVLSGTREVVVVWVHVKTEELDWLKNYEKLP